MPNGDGDRRATRRTDSRGALDAKGAGQFKDLEARKLQRAESMNTDHLAANTSSVLRGLGVSQEASKLLSK